MLTAFNLYAPILVISAIALALGLLGYFLYRTVIQQRKATTPRPYPDSQFIQIQHHRIHFRQAGRGRDIVLLHGIGASVFIWRTIFPLLAQKYRVTAIDLLGFGASDKPSGTSLGLDQQAERIHQLLAKLRLKNPILIGSSMGGTIALWLLHRFANDYPGGIVLAPATNPKLVKPWHKWFMPLGQHLHRGLTHKVMQMILHLVIANRKVITPEVINGYMQPYLDDGQGVKAFFSAVELLRDPRLPQDLRNIQVPTLIIWGSHDKLVPRKTMMELRQIIPSTKWAEHPLGGHHIMEDQPDWTYQKITDFIDESLRVEGPRISR